MTTPARSPSAGEAAPRRRVLVIVLVTLFVTGWAANHFAALLPLLARLEGFPRTVLDGAFGVYALGLLPGLLGGGALSDRLGRRPVVLVGATTAALGNLLMLLWHPEAGVFIGRLVVGVGVGLTVSAGTAWTGDLAGKRGTALAGTLLTCGFGAGPLVVGLLALLLAPPRALSVAFLLTVCLSLGAVGLAGRTATPVDTGTGDGPADPESDRLGRALLASLPMALWVFATVTVPLVTLSGRMPGVFSGPLGPGVAAAVALGAGVLMQLLARRLTWGRAAGVVGAGLAAVGYLLGAVAGVSLTTPLFLLCAVVLGAAYGLCLRAGLIDVEAFAPRRSRGLAIGIFWVVSYLGFGLPLLLELIGPAYGLVRPMIVLAAGALVAAVLRAISLRPARLSGPRPGRR